MSHRPYRPSFENLEKREVFSAGPIDVPVPQGYYRYEIENTLVSSLVSTDVSSKGAANFSSRGGMRGSPDGLVGDFNGDGQEDLASVSGSNTWTGPVTLARDNIMAEWTSGGDYALVRVAAGDIDADGRDDLAILPYLEQDNHYKSSLPFSNTVLDDEAFVAPIHLDLLGVVFDLNDFPHDAVFSELSSTGGMQVGLMDGMVRGFTEVTDLVENTPLAALQTSDGAKSLLTPAVQKVRATILASDEYFSRYFDGSDVGLTSLLGSPEYRSVGSMNGGVWKTTNFDRGYLSPY